MKTSLVLFGFKGVGKTFLGQQLASLLLVPFVDTDALLLQNHPDYSSIRNLYQTVGEEKFRKMEADVILSLRPSPSIIALGGGAILSPSSQAHLQTIGRLIYLQASLSTLQKRFDQKHPLEKLYEERTAIYEQIPALQIDTDLFSKEQILHTLVQYGV